MPAVSEDWPSFRGPQHNGVSAEAGWLAQWPESGPKIAWRQDVGIGVASFAVVGQRVLTMGNHEDQDRVWCLERSKVPVQIYSPQGELVESWGQGQFKGPHSLRFDPEGNVWITDYLAHVVKKLTRHGQLLLTLGTGGQLGNDENHFNAPTDTAITMRWLSRMSQPSMTN